MDDDWSRLLDGPRGRRLAALIAVEVERRHWPAISMGTLGPLEVAYFYSEIERPTANPFTDPGQDETTEEEDLIAALNHLAMEPLDEAALPSDLTEVVNSARYWQEPDRIEGFPCPP